MRACVMNISGLQARFTAYFRILTPALLILCPLRQERLPVLWSALTFTARFRLVSRSVQRQDCGTPITKISAPELVSHTSRSTRSPLYCEVGTASITRDYPR